MINFDDDYNNFGDVDSDNFVKIGTLAELKEKGSINKKILGKWVSVFGTSEEDMYAMEYGCKHHGANLAEGEICNGIVTCPRHFWKYDMKTGKSLTEKSPDLRKHSLRTKDGDIYVTISPINR